MKNLIVLLFILPSLALSQEKMVKYEFATQTIDGTIDEMLRIVNGEKGKTRNWEAFKDLFLPTTRFTVVNYLNESSYESATIDEMIEFMQDDYYDLGYKELMLSRKIDEFNGIAQVIEVVEHTEPNGNVAKGLNSYHLVYAKQRWWIANLIWTFETDDFKIPEKYLKNE